jgi:YbbR domain-containing protein
VVHSLGTAEVHAAIDLRSVTPGEHTYDLTSKNIRVPNGVEVAQVIPSQFRISFDKRATKRVEIRPRVIGAAAPGFRMEDVKVDPDTVTIIGPEKRVNSIDSVITDPVDASGVMGRVTFNTHVYVSDPLVRLSNPGPVHVTVVTDTKAHTPTTDRP